jgi:hypothetical protein
VPKGDAHLLHQANCGKRPNSALLTDADAYASPLRAQRGAAKRGRYADGPEISLSVKFVDGTRIRVGSGQG